MRRTRKLGGFAAVSCLLVALVGCDDECKKGHSECLSGGLIRTCVPTDDGNEWLVHQCKESEQCVEQDDDESAGMGGGEMNDGGVSSDESSATASAVCVGTCEMGESACVNDSLARFCVHGGVWQLDACELGEKCVDGQCMIGEGDGFVQRCTPGETVCAGEKTRQVCSADGTTWVPEACTASEICEDGECVPDPASSCDDGNRCLDNQTALRCLGEGDGFEMVECEDGTYCRFGVCRGDVCSIGSTCNGPNQVRECVDGTNYVDTQCASNEVCRQVGDHASCEPITCNPGTSQCGDPRDEDVDPEKFFTTCMMGANSSVPEWVQGECTGLTTCDPAQLAGGSPCRQDCTPGSQRCNSDPDGIEDGWQECQDDGTWGPVQRCNSDDESRLQCAIKPSDDASALPETVCAEPVCWWVINNMATGAEGACEGAQLRACQEDGTLGDADDCEIGICRDVSGTVLSDGRSPGRCDPDTACEEGEERCVDGTSSRYQTCVNGQWSTQLSSCEDDGVCVDYTDHDGITHKLCGAECAPGARHCNGDGELETCNDDGEWGSATACEMGECTHLGNNDAACVLECVPGEKACTGSNAVASDGVHQGTSHEAVCNDDGTLETATACASGTVCRETSSGEVLGCVECIGPDAPGGNTQGVADSRCDPGTPENLQDCGSDNTWEDGRECGGDTSCIGPAGPSCGNCFSDQGAWVVCTETNIRDNEVCGGCDVSYDHDADPGTADETESLVVCTQTNIATATAGPGVVTTCEDAGHGSASSWGGYADCCGDAQSLAEYSCEDVSAGSEPVSAGGYADCCSHSLQASGGVSYAYCGG